MNTTSVLGFFLAAASLGCAAELAMPRVSVQPGSSVSADIRLSGQGAQIAGIQFSLESSSNVTITAAAGPAAIAAGKSLNTSEGGGKKTFMIAGLNQTLIGDGVVVALTITSPAGAASASYALKTSLVFATNASGVIVPLTAVDGSVTVGAPSTLPTVGAFAHLASGGTWKTTFLVVNLSSTPAAVRLLFWDDNGNALSLPLTSPQTGGPPAGTASSLEWTIPAAGSLIVESEAPKTGPILQGSAELQAAADVTGYAIFRQQVETSRTAEGVSPFENRNRTSYLLPFDETSGFVTGVALTNLSSTASAAVNVVLRDDAGNQVGTDAVTLNPRGHTAYVVSQRLSTIAGRRGTLELRNGSGGNIAVLGLRFNQYSSFTSMPVVPR